MELKHWMLSYLIENKGLLIVPYGIETSLLLSRVRTRYRLLIVPYGIETS